MLALNPDDFDPTNPDNGAVENIIPELILNGDDLPGENPEELTPYGPLGFIEVLADDADAETAADADPADAETDPAADAAVDNEEG